MAQIILGAKTILNLSTDLDPMFTELYAATAYSTTTTFTIGNGSATRTIVADGGTAAAQGAAFFGRRGNVNSFAFGDAGAILGGAETADTLIYAYGGKNLRFYTNNMQRAQINADGNVGFGYAGPNYGANTLTVGVNAATSSIFDLAVASARIMTFSATAAEGAIGTTTAKDIYVFTNGAERMRFLGTGAVAAGADNAQTLGTAAKRWSTVYAGTGAINTSDAREKTQVYQLTAEELSAAKQIAREFGTYQFLSAVQEKGDAARMHAGTTVQRVIQIMEYFGLDAMRYAFICYDEWDAEHDSDGNETRAAGNRYSFRPDELMMFVARGIAARQDELEARIAALEP